jgi:hypothetical protein
MFSQSFNWAIQYNHYCVDETRGMGCDSFGNIYLTGYSHYYSGNSQSQGYSYPMFYKFKPNGKIVWKDTLGHYVVNSVTDKSGNTFMIVGNAVFKYNSSGQQIWATTIQGKLFRGLCLRPGGGIITVGEGTNYTISSITAIDDNGQISWSRLSDFNGRPHCVTCDKQGNCYVAGDTSVPTGYISKLKKYDNSGNLVLSKKVLYQPTDITVANDSNIYIAGVHYLTLTTTTLFVAAYNPAVNLVWNTQIINDNAAISGIKINDQNEIFITGMYYHSIDCGGISLATPYYEMFLFKLNKFGTTISGQTSTGPAYTDAGSNGSISPKRMILSGEDILIAGEMSGIHMCDTITVVGPPSYSDLFLCKINNPHVIASIETRPHSSRTFNFFPSPTSGLFNIESNTENPNIRVIIINSAGQTVYTENNHKVNGTYNKVFDLSALPKGIYFVEVNTGEQRTIKKIVLE